MTPLDAMKQALEALDAALGYGTERVDSKLKEEITNLRTAITELESAEPVAITEKLVCDVLDEANITFRRHAYGVRGQMVTIWDSKESHIVAAAIRLTHPEQSRDSIIEECAAVCEEVHSRYPTDIFPEGQSVTAQSAKMARITANNCALEIRALKGE